MINLKTVVVLLAVIAVCYGAKDKYHKKKHHHHHGIRHHHFLYYLTFLAIKLKIVFFLGTIFTVSLVAAKVVALIKFTEYMKHKYHHEEKIVYVNPHEHHDHDYGGYPGGYSSSDFISSKAAYPSYPTATEQASQPPCILNINITTTVLVKKEPEPRYKQLLYPVLDPIPLGRPRKSAKSLGASSDIPLDQPPSDAYIERYATVPDSAQYASSKSSSGRSSIEGSWGSTIYSEFEKMSDRLRQMNITEMALNEMDIKDEHCKKKFICNADYNAQHNIILRTGLDILSDASYQKLKTNSTITSEDECESLHQQCKDTSETEN